MVIAMESTGTYSGTNHCVSLICTVSMALKYHCHVPCVSCQCTRTNPVNDSLSVFLSLDSRMMEKVIRWWTSATNASRRAKQAEQSRMQKLLSLQPRTLTLGHGRVLRQPRLQKRLMLMGGSSPRQNSRVEPVSSNQRQQQQQLSFLVCLIAG